MCRSQPSRVSLTRSPWRRTPFFWLELQAAAAVEEPSSDVELQIPAALHQNDADVESVFAKDWAQFIADAEVAVLEPALLEWLPRKRWFGAKTRKIESVRVRNWVEAASDAKPPDTSTNDTPEAMAIPSALFFFDVTYFDGPADIYQIPLSVSTGAALNDITERQPDSIIAKLTTATGPAILHDATVSEDFPHELLSLIASNATLPVLESRKSTEAAGNWLDQSSSD